MKKKNKDLEWEKDGFLISLTHFCYIGIGKRFRKIGFFKKYFEKKTFNQQYEEALLHANIRVLPEEFFFMVHFSIFSFAILLLFLLILIFFVYPDFVVPVFYLGIILTSCLGVFLFNYPFIIVKERREEIDAALPYLVPYLKILSKELGFADILKIIPNFLLYKELRLEFSRIKYFNEILGFDLHNSVKEAMKFCPSKKLSDMLNDLVTITNSGGDIYYYLSKKLGDVYDDIDSVEKKNVETLLIFSQIYVILLLIAPLFFAIISAVLNLISLSSQTGQVDFQNTFLLILILPFCYIGFMFLIYYSKPLYSRLRIN